MNDEFNDLPSDIRNELDKIEADIINKVGLTVNELSVIYYIRDFNIIKEVNGFILGLSRWKKERERILSRAKGRIYDT